MINQIYYDVDKNQSEYNNNYEWNKENDKFKMC